AAGDRGVARVGADLRLEILPREDSAALDRRRRLAALAASVVGVPRRERARRSARAAPGAAADAPDHRVLRADRRLALAHAAVDGLGALPPHRWARRGFAAAAGVDRLRDDVRDLERLPDARRTYAHRERSRGEPLDARARRRARADSDGAV